jgi:hypothetical protein
MPTFEWIDDAPPATDPAKKKTGPVIEPVDEREVVSPPLAASHGIAAQPVAVEAPKPVDAALPAQPTPHAAAPPQAQGITDYALTAAKQAGAIGLGVVTAPALLGIEVGKNPKEAIPDIYRGAKAALSRTPEAFTQQFAGAARSLGEVSEEKPVTEFDEATGQYVERNQNPSFFTRPGVKQGDIDKETSAYWGEVGGKATADIERDRKADPRTTMAGKLVEGAGESIIQMAPGAALSMAGAPQAGLYLMGAQTFGQKYAEDRAAGKSIEDSTKNSMLQAGAEVATELAPAYKLSKFMKPGAFGRKALEYMQQEVPFEMLATALQNSSDKFYAEQDPDKRWQQVFDYLGSHQFAQDEVDTFWQTILQGMVMSGAGKVARKATGAQDLTPDQQELYAKYEQGVRDAVDFGRFFGKPGVMPTPPPTPPAAPASPPTTPPEGQEPPVAPTPPPTINPEAFTNMGAVSAAVQQPWQQDKATDPADADMAAALAELKGQQQPAAASSTLPAEQEQAVDLTDEVPAPDEQRNAAIQDEQQAVQQLTQAEQEEVIDLDRRIRNIGTVPAAGRTEAMKANLERLQRQRAALEERKQAATKTGAEMSGVGAPAANEASPADQPKPPAAPAEPAPAVTPETSPSAAKPIGKTIFAKQAGADKFLAENGLAETHEVVETKGGKFAAQPRAEVAQGEKINSLNTPPDTRIPPGTILPTSGEETSPADVTAPASTGNPQHDAARSLLANKRKPPTLFKVTDAGASGMDKYLFAEDHKGKLSIIKPDGTVQPASEGIATRVFQAKKQGQTAPFEIPAAPVAAQSPPESSAAAATTPPPSDASTSPPDAPTPPGKKQRSLAQMANDAKLKQRRTKIDPEADDLIMAISKLGGLNQAQVQQQWGNTVVESTHLKKNIVFGKPALHKKGMPIDRMRESLIEHGYLPEGADIRAFEEAFTRAAAGEKVMTAKGDVVKADEVYAAEEKRRAEELAYEEALRAAAALDPDFASLVASDRSLKDASEDAIAAAYDIMEELGGELSLPAVDENYLNSLVEEADEETGAVQGTQGADQSTSPEATEKGAVPGSDRPAEEGRTEVAPTKQTKDGQHGFNLTGGKVAFGGKPMDSTRTHVDTLEMLDEMDIADDAAKQDDLFAPVAATASTDGADHDEKMAEFDEAFEAFVAEQPEKNGVKYTSVLVDAFMQSEVRKADPVKDNHLPLLDLREMTWEEKREAERKAEEEIKSSPRGTWRIVANKYEGEGRDAFYRFLMSDGRGQRLSLGSGTDTSPEPTTFANAYKRMIEGEVARTTSKQREAAILSRGLADAEKFKVGMVLKNVTLSTATGRVNFPTLTVTAINKNGTVDAIATRKGVAGKHNVLGIDATALTKFFPQEPERPEQVSPGGLFAEPQPAEKPEEEPPGQFDSKAWNDERDDRIKQSKAAGNTHLDQVTPSVETMRGKKIYNVHDHNEKGAIRTVSNNGDVVVHWSDSYSAGKNLATEKQEVRGKKRVTVFESWLMPSDLKDYVFEAAAKKSLGQLVDEALAGSTPLTEADKLRRKSDALTKEAAKIMEGIEPGQPVLSVADRNRREKALAKQSEAADLVRQAEALEAKPARFEVGKALTKEERQQVLDTLTDVYKENRLEMEERIDGRGETYWAWPHRPEYFVKSDVTGAMVRFYVTLPDGKVAHPSELFPEMTQAVIDKKISEQAAVEKQEDLSNKEMNERADRLANPDRMKARATYIETQTNKEQAGEKAVDFYSEQEGKWFATQLPDRAAKALAGRGYKRVTKYQQRDGKWFVKEYDDGSFPAEVISLEELGQKWDGENNDGLRERLIVAGGWVTAAGKLNPTGRRLAKTKWDIVTPGTKEILLRQYAATDKVEPGTAPATSKINSVASRETFNDRMLAGEVTVEEYRAAFASLMANKSAILADLDKLTKPQLFERYPGIEFRYKNEKKADAVQAAYDSMLGTFNLGDSITFSMGVGSYEKALQAKVDGYTQADLDKYAADYKKNVEERKQRMAERAEGVKDPKTIDDFKTLLAIRAREAGKPMTFGELRMSLTPEQRATFDELTATETRSGRKETKDSRATEVRTAEQKVDGQIIETKHTQKGHNIFVVQLAERVSKEDYTTLNAAAKKLGGYYSSFRGRGAVPGFQFKTKDEAQAFVDLAAGDKTAAKEAVRSRRDAFEDDRSQTAAERLTSMADALEERADAISNADRKTNTARRAAQASSAEAGASNMKALAKTMRNIARAIESDSAKFLDRVRQKVQVELLSDAVRSAKRSELRAKYPEYIDQEKHQYDAATGETADYADWPMYTMYRSDLANLGRKLIEKDGTKKLGQRLLKVADDVTDAYLKFAKENLTKVATFTKTDGGIAAFTSKADAEASIARSGYKGKAIAYSVKRNEHLIIMSPSMAREKGAWKGDDDKRITLAPDFGAELVTTLSRRGGGEAPWQFESVKRRRDVLSRMGIETPAEFRAALREFIALQEQAEAPDKIKQMERAMIGRRKDGLDFFPTPQEAADAMIEAAEIEPGMAILEPSAGMGHIADRIREAGVEPDVIELSGDRRELLEAKGYNVVGTDFLEVDGQYDRIIMNPPFSDRRDAEHVQHAYELLRPGGRIVAIMGEGVFFGQDKKAVEFRAWLENVGGTSEKLGEGTFLDPTLPVNTGVNARMVVISKGQPSGEKAFFSRAEKADTINVDSIERPTTNSEGRPIHATEEGIRNFWKWFAGSAVVDEQGRPLVVYHGTPNGEFNAFTKKGRGDHLLGGTQKRPGVGFHYSKALAETYALEKEPSREGDTPKPHVFEVYVSAKNPWDYENSEHLRLAKAALEAHPKYEGWMSKELARGDWEAVEAKPVQEAIRAAGFDAFYANDNPGKAINIFDPSQVKSATGNNVAFDQGSADIRYSIGQDSTSGVTTDQLEELVAQFAGNSPVEFVIKQSPRQWGFAAVTDAAGAYHLGKIYLAADNISTPENAGEVIAHELIGHYGQRGFFGDRLNDALDRIHGNNPLIKKYAAKWIRDNQDVITEYKLDATAVRYRAIEEAMAKMAEEQRPYNAALKLVRTLQELLRAVGLNNLANKLEASTNAEALAALDKAGLYVKTGQTAKNSTPAFDFYPKAKMALQAMFNRGETETEIVAGKLSASLAGNTIHLDFRKVDEETWQKAKLFVLGNRGRYGNVELNFVVERPSGATIDRQHTAKLDEYLNEPAQALKQFKASGGLTVSLREAKNARQIASRQVGAGNAGLDRGVPETPGERTRAAAEAWIETAGWSGEAEHLGQLADAALRSIEEGKPVEAAIADFGRKFDRAFSDNPNIAPAIADLKKLGVKYDSPESFIRAVANLHRAYNGKPSVPVFSRRQDTDTSPRPIRRQSSGNPVVNASRDFAGWLFSEGMQTTRWQRTVGTMYHMAEMLERKGKPQLKAFFNKSQDFLSDISTIAIQAEREAPTIFPRLGVGSGIVHRGVSKEDNRVVSEALMEGTLFGGGDPLKGKLWSDEELKEKFGATGRQIKIYKEARKAVDQSLDDFNKSLVARYAKEAKVYFDRDQSASDMGDEVADLIDQKIAIMQDALDDQVRMFKQLSKDFSGDPAVLKKAETAFKRGFDQKTSAIELEKTRAANIRELVSRTQQLKDKGYFPSQRFGDHTVRVTEPGSRKPLYYAMHPSAGAAKRDAARFRAAFPNAEIVLDTVDKEGYKLYAGMNLEVLQLFAEHLGADEAAPYQEYLRLAVNNHSALKKLIHREGTEGYDLDGVRVLANFIVSNARHASTQYHMSDMRKMAAEITDGGDVKTQAVKLYEYLSKPMEEASKYRAFLFMHYIGGSVMSGLINMTQPVVMTAPYMTQHYSHAQVVAALNKAAALSFKKPENVGGALGHALRKAEDAGVTAPQEIHQMMAMASNRLFASNNLVNSSLKAWGGFFAVAEAFNRRTTFIAAFNLAKKAGLTDREAYNRAEKTVTETQGLYNKGNRPNWARGAIKASLFTFKQFSVMYIELFLRLPPKQKALMLGFLFLAGGGEGLPFYEDLADIIDTFAQWSGHAWNTKADTRRLAYKVVPKPVADFAFDGVSSVLPIDIKSRMGLGNLIPGTGIFKMSNQGMNKASDAMEFFGPTGGLIKASADTLQMIASGMYVRAARAAAPRAAQHAWDGIDMYRLGHGLDKYGKRTIDVTKGEAVSKVIGANPRKVAEEGEIKRAIRQDVELVRVKRAGIVDKMARSLINGDIRLYEEADAAMEAWNTNNPTLPIRVTKQQIRAKATALQATSKERFIKSMPKEMRDAVLTSEDE